jgi:hypothetical protein
MTQNSEEYLRLVLGEQADKQWHQLFPERYKQEVALMQEAHPELTLSLNNNGNICWDGEITVATNLGNIKADYNPLQIKIDCKRDYPLSFPLVIDLKKILINRGCEHVIDKNSGAICYAFRPTSELDFIEKHFVKDLIPVIQVFLLKQFCYEKTKTWPGAEEHGEKAFIIYEFEHGCINLNELCPCTLTGKSYKACHLRQVEKKIESLDCELRRHYDIIQLGRNDKCLCGSNKKYKKCCYISGGLGEGRTYYTQKYKGLTKPHLLDLLSGKPSEKS